MWYAYVDLSEIKKVEYHVGEGSSEEDNAPIIRARNSAWY